MSTFETIKEAVENGTYTEPTGIELAEAGARKIRTVGNRIRERAKAIRALDHEIKKLHEDMKKGRK